MNRGNSGDKNTNEHSFFAEMMGEFEKNGVLTDLSDQGADDVDPTLTARSSSLEERITSKMDRTQQLAPSKPDTFKYEDIDAALESESEDEKPLHLIQGIPEVKEAANTTSKSSSKKAKKLKRKSARPLSTINTQPSAPATESAAQETSNVTKQRTLHLMATFETDYIPPKTSVPLSFGQTEPNEEVERGLKSAPAEPSDSFKFRVLSLIDDFDISHPDAAVPAEFPFWDIEKEIQEEALLAARRGSVPVVPSPVGKQSDSSSIRNAHELEPVPEETEGESDGNASSASSTVIDDVDREWLRFALSTGRPLSQVAYGTVPKQVSRRVSRTVSLVSNTPAPTPPSSNVDVEQAIEKSDLKASSSSASKSRIRWSKIIFSLLFLGLLAGGVMLILWRVGVLNSQAQAAGEAQEPKKGPDVIDIPKPTQQLIIDPKIAPGPLGCSNFPVRAPLKSSDYVAQFSGGGSNSTSASGSSGFLSIPPLSCSGSAIRYSLTECDLLRAMTASDGNEIGSGVDKAYMDKIIKRYLPHLQTAIEAFDLNCSPERLANFLAQVRHETNQLKTMYQPIDGGAGAVHMIPAHFPRIISQVKPVRKAFDVEFGDSAEASFQQMSELAKRPKGQWTPDEQTFMARTSTRLGSDSMTFLVGAWWFTFGSKQTLGDKGCADLRTDSDAGLGDKNEATMSGFFKVTTCIYGTIADPGLQQRQGYYEDTLKAASKYWKCQTKQCSK